jgi:hypothetical protein
MIKFKLVPAKIWQVAERAAGDSASPVQDYE